MVSIWNVFIFQKQWNYSFDALTFMNFDSYTKQEIEKFKKADPTTKHQE